MRMLGFVVVRMKVGMVMRMGMTVRVRGSANGDWDDGLVGYTAALPFGEYSQALQDSRDQGINDRARDGCCGCRVVA